MAAFFLWIYAWAFLGCAAPGLWRKDLALGAESSEAAAGLVYLADLYSAEGKAAEAS